MSATTSQPPVIPPRPSRSQDKAQIPKIPPRPVRSRVDRSMSPSRDRFAPSPLNEHPPRLGGKSPLSPGSLGSGNVFGGSTDPVARSPSVDLPSLGEEGREYAVVAEKLGSDREESASPEQTRSVADDLKLHAPKPSLPATSAKQRVATVTRTDSDKAASFGIGRPSSEEPASSGRSLRKKPSTISQLSGHTDSHVDDEHGIPEIGKQVPMYPNAGDVQAPSPAPGLLPSSDGSKTKHHVRRGSARGFASDLPPGSYGLHGHGVKSTDKLEKAYYEKHPELIQKERQPHHHDRANDFSMSREELNKIVRNTANNRLSGQDFSAPPEQVGWEAIEESTSRMTSPKPSGPNSPVLTRGFHPGNLSDAGKSLENVIHIEDPRRRSGIFDVQSPGIPAESENNEGRYSAPILADDEVSNDVHSSSLHPAVDPSPERTGSAFEMEPSTRPRSRPASIYRESSHDVRSTPLEDVKEYEPLFPEDDKPAVKSEAPTPTTSKRNEDRKHKFPSRDVWEDAPDSVHGTAEVSTPDVQEPQEFQYKPRAVKEVPPRDSDTPAQAFARRQEELAEQESRDNPDAFLYRTQKPAWVQGQPHLAKETLTRPSSTQSGHSTHQFPSRDVWEDVPDSQLLEAEVSKEQDAEEEGEEVSSTTEPTQAPHVPQRPVRKGTDPSEKPAIPDRPKPKQTPSDDGGVTAAKPVVPERPKPQVPARPKKQLSGSSKDGDSPSPVAKAKPPVPARPVGGKIAALQAGFMADLNKRLQLGPQAHKPDETAKEEEEEEEAPVPAEKEKVPLADARKGRARGPQRRAPAKSPAPPTEAAIPAKSDVPALSFSVPVSYFSVDPEEGLLAVGGSGEAKESAPPQEPPRPEPTAEAAAESSGAATVQEDIGAAEPPAVEKADDTLGDKEAAEPKLEAVTADAPVETLAGGDDVKAQKKAEPAATGETSAE